MNLFDIIGPIMVGPSSSHTAGAVRIGLIARRLMGEPIHSVTLCLHGSFLATGKGHGTDRALVAGLLGMNPDDIRIPQSFDLAQQSGLDFHFSSVNLKDVHPNTVVLKMAGKSGRNLEIVASSIGGGRIQICQIDGLKVNFSGEMPTLIVHNIDQPGYVTEVTSVLGSKHINIATMQLYRDIRGGHAIMVIECDDEIPPIVIQWLEQMSGVLKVTYLSLNADEKASQ
ncbi:MAG: L-serine ammonia-lyase, iron-sulfur-dependent subunit beta [Robinsoniella sp.]|nr:L-serine ammonia-lyase, iron-sulfur-dependent subunit beta [Robinsoniella sp.]